MLFLAVKAAEEAKLFFYGYFIQFFFHFSLFFVAFSQGFFLSFDIQMTFGTMNLKKEGKY